MSDEFRNFVSLLTYKDGTIHQGPIRYILVPASWLAGLGVEMENVLGASGAYVVVHTASEAAAKTYGEILTQLFGGMPPKEMMALVVQTARALGWGDIQLVEFNETPLTIKLRVKDTYLSGIVSEADEPKCYLFSSVMCVIQTLLQKAGVVSGALEYEETSCVASGASHCEFIIREQE